MVEIVNPQDAVRVDLDLKMSRIRNKWLRVCGPCDAGLSGECTHPDEDYRTVIADLVTDLEKFREHAALLSASTMGEAFDRLEELVDKEKDVELVVTWLLERVRQIGETQYPDEESTLSMEQRAHHYADVVEGIRSREWKR